MSLRFAAGWRRWVLVCACLPTLVSGGCIAPQALPIAAPTAQSIPGAITGSVSGSDSGAPAPTQAAEPAADTPFLSTAEQIAQTIVPERDLTALAQRLNPELVVPTGAAAARPIAQVGDHADFWVLNSDTAEVHQIAAELVYQNDRVSAWVQAGQTLDSDLIRRAADDFVSQTWPAETSVFGHEATPGIDGDPHIHMLFTTGMGGSVIGYFLSNDTVSRAVLPTSNEREMFYINSDYAASGVGQQGLDPLLAHEFQHMIHYAHDRNEATWVNEGMSEVAKDIAGYQGADGGYLWFNSSSDTQLNAWGDGAGENMAHYAAAYLFLSYLAQRLGDDVLSQIVNEPADGIEGIENALAHMGAPDFDSFFADWIVALAADSAAGPATEAIWHIDAADVDWPSSRHTVTALVEAGGAEVVHNYAADFLLMDPALITGTLSFDGATETTVSKAGAASGELAWWGNRADMSDTRLTRSVDLSAVSAGQPVTMTASLWWDIEENFDFAYLMASRDGTDWDILPGTRTREPGDNANQLGPAYTGISQPAPEATGPEVTGPEVTEPEITEPEATGPALAPDPGWGADPAWVTDTFDLSAYAGGPVFVRFEYVTDDAVTRPGIHVDDVRIPAIGYADDFESGAPRWESEGWVSEGWLLTDGRLDQRWLLQVIEIAADGKVTVRRPEVDAQGHAEIDLAARDPSTTTWLAISGMTAGTTELAPYRITLSNSTVPSGD